MDIILNDLALTSILFIILLRGVVVEQIVFILYLVVVFIFYIIIPGTSTR